MNLAKLFAETPLTEEFALPFNDDYQPDFNPMYSKIVGTANSSEIWASRYYGEAADTYGILGDDGTVLAYLIIKPTDQLYEIHKIWVHIDHRSSSYATALLYFVVKKLKIQLLSGLLVTQLGKEFLKRLMSNTKFKTTIVDNELNMVSANFDDAIKNKNYQILIKHTIFGDDRLFGHSNFKTHRQLYREYDLFENEL